jgi:peroxiredoxin
MARILVLLILSTFFLSACAQKKDISFTIRGKVINARPADRLYFYDNKAGVALLNSDNTFEYTGILSFPMGVMCRTSRSNMSIVWIGGDTVNLTLEELTDTAGNKKLRITSLSGPPETEMYYTLQKQFFALLKDDASSPGSNRTDSVMASFYPAVASYISKNPGSALAASLPGIYPFSTSQKQQLLSLLDPNENKQVILSLKEDIARSALLKPGTVLPDWKQEALDGSMFSFYSLKAEYILLEFWGSSCYPCRLANPGLKKIYEAYHPKGFDIVGISLDVKKKAWKNAVEKDQLPWTQVSDLKGSKNALASAYRVNGIPFNILVNKNHEIIAVNLQPQQLADKLKELL